MVDRVGWEGEEREGSGQILLATGSGRAGR